MNKIIEILMRRDGLDYMEALAAYEECKEEIYESLNGTSCIGPDEVLASELGLEPDYLIYFT